MSIKYLSLALVILTWSLSAHANLVLNGSFEQAPTGTSLGGGSGWSYYSADSINGWQGDNMELWIGRNPKAYDGDYHIELNAHGRNDGPWSIYQNLNTIAGQDYHLTFAYRARRGHSNTSAEAFRVMAADLDVAVTDHVVNQWLIFDGFFTAASETTTLRFESIFPYSSTIGNFIDDVRVSSVPEPGSMVLLGLGLLGLCVLRKNVE